MLGPPEPWGSLPRESVFNCGRAHRRQERNGTRPCGLPAAGVSGIGLRAACPSARRPAPCPLGCKDVFDTIKLNVRFDVHEVQEAGDWAWARTSSAGRTRISSDGAEITEGNNELFVFRRENGSWKIHRYFFSSSRPFRAWLT